MADEEVGGRGSWTRPVTKKDRAYMLWVDTGSRLFSTCSRRQYMSVIVARNGRVIGTGYNGGAPGTQHCVDGGCERANRPPETRDEDYSDCIAIHAEANAIIHGDVLRMEGATIYTNGDPCFACAKMILGAGIDTVVYLSEGLRSQGADYLAECGVTLVPFEHGVLYPQPTVEM